MCELCEGGPPTRLDWDALLGWYAAAARELPWRRGDTTPWGVLVSEVMLQQTPVARVLAPYAAWLARWPTPAALAADAPGAAVRQWGTLGYPRRALRLHAAARAMVERHGGDVPDDPAELRALPGVGAYTQRAVAAFAFRHPTLPLDTNVRRVLARAVHGRAAPGGTTPTRGEQRAADALLSPDAAAAGAVAVMELGALVCTTRAPRCDRCPITASCAWWSGAQRPASPRARSRGNRPYAGSDRQARGALLAVLRAAAGPVDPDALVVPGLEADDGGADARQRRRALKSLLADGLVERLPDGRFALPGDPLSA